jgi:uncharacterized coiled-coil DUF342 family protein
MNVWCVDDVVDPAPTINLETPLDDLQDQLDFIVEEIVNIEQMIDDLRERVNEYDETRHKLAKKIDELEEELDEVAAA